LALERSQISGSTQNEKFELITTIFVGTKKPDAPDNVQCEIGTRSPEIDNIGSQAHGIFNGDLNLYKFLKRQTFLEQEANIYIGFPRILFSRAGTEKVGANQPLVFFKGWDHDPRDVAAVHD